MIKFPAETLLAYLGELIEIDPCDEYEFKNHGILSEVDDFLAHPKDEWDLSDVSALHIWELFVQEAILNSRFTHLVNANTDEYAEKYELFYRRYWGSDFTKTFFDPAPNPMYSLAGWINFNYVQAYVNENEIHPSLSLHPVLMIVNLLLDKSPTCDELLTESIVDQFLTFQEQGDEDGKVAWLYSTGNDLIYESTKVIHSMIEPLRQLLESEEDSLTHELGETIFSDIQDDYLGVLTSELPLETINLTAICVVANMVDMIEETLL